MKNVLFPMYAYAIHEKHSRASRPLVTPYDRPAPQNMPDRRFFYAYPLLWSIAALSSRKSVPHPAAPAMARRTGPQETTAVRNLQANTTIETIANAVLPIGQTVHFETETGEDAQALRTVAVGRDGARRDTVTLCDAAGDVHGPFEYAFHPRFPDGEWRFALAEILYLLPDGGAPVPCSHCFGDHDGCTAFSPRCSAACAAQNGVDGAS